MYYMMMADLKSWLLWQNLIVAVSFLVLAVAVIASTSTAGDENGWRTKPLADLNVNESYVSQMKRGVWDEMGGAGNVDFYNISVDRSNVCIMTPVRIFLASRSIGNAHLVAKVEGSDFVSYMGVEEVLHSNINGGGLVSDTTGGNIISSGSENMNSRNNNASSLIECLSDEDLHCSPSVQDIFVDPVRNILTLSFHTNTTEPDLSSTSLVLRALAFHPPAVGKMHGVWKSPQSLEIFIDSTFASDIIKYFSAKNKVEITVRKFSSNSVNSIWSSVSWLNMSQRIRFKEEGLHYVFAVNSETMSLISNVVAIRASHCKDPIVSKYDGFASYSNHPSTSDLQSSEHLDIAAKPIIVHDGVLAITGSNAIKIPQMSVPGMASGTWSLSMWVYLLDAGLTSEYQTLFFKGDTTGNILGRSPSAWLLPSSRLITFRFSTESNPDIGGETLKDITLGQWQLLTFTFLNLSTPEGIETTDFATDLSSSVDIVDSNGRTKTINHSLDSKHEQKRHHYSQFLNYKITNRTKYLASVYLNDGLDITIEFPMTVVGNDGPLQLFKDISHKGPKAFSSGIIMWSSVLSPGEVKALYAKGPPAASKAVGASMAILSSTLLMKNSLLAAESAKHDTKPIFDSYFRSKRGDVSLVAHNVNRVDEDIISQSVDIDTDSMISSTISGYQKIDSNILATELFEKAKASTAACSSYETRLDLYAEASSMGNVAALHTWAMLYAFGFESPDNKCGIEATSRGRRREFDHSDNKNSDSDDDDDDGWNDPYLTRSLIAFSMCVELGATNSIVPLVSLINSGLGLRAFEVMSDLSLNFDSNYYKAIPLPYFLQEFKGNRQQSFHVLLSRKILSYSAIITEEDEKEEIQSNEGIDEQDYKENQFHESSYSDEHLDNYFVDEGSSSPNKAEEVKVVGKTYKTSSRQSNLPLGISVSDMQVIASVPSLESSFYAGKSSEDNTYSNIYCSGDEEFRDCISLTDLLTGLLYVSAISGHAEAQAILSYRYQHGIAVKKDVESAAFYAYLASIVASDEFHRVGGQPVAETDRINDKTEFEVEKGTKGNEDEIIQAQIIRANEGDVPAMMATADLYYFGARGLERNQARALDLYTRAGDAGNLNGKCGAAAMYLKGEGTEANSSKAIEIYENAAALGSMKALNGLGYIYFYGQSAPKNETTAFYYFLAAAETETDGDSLFNAGFCLENGIGIEKDLKRAAALYLVGARKFGHFDAIKNLGMMHYEGRGVLRNPHEALAYLSVAQGIGPWVGWNRRGLDQYLSKDYSKSLNCYVYAGEFGFEVSQSNAAFISRRRFNGRSYSYLALRELLLSSYHQNSASTVQIGAMHLQDEYVPGDSLSAIWWLTRASSLGNGLASMYLGVMHNFGVGVEINLPRAKRYYLHAIDAKGAEIEYQLKFMMKALIWLIDNFLNGGYIYGIVSPILGYFVKDYLLVMHPN